MRVSESSDALPAGDGGTTRGPLRWLRGAVVGLTATGLAGAGHAIAGGMLPDLEHLAVLALVAVGTAVWLSGRRWSTPSLLLVLLGAQGLFHVVFSGEATDMGAMHHHAPAGVMVAAHVVAAVVTAVLLRRGEDWCWSLLELLRRPWSAPAVPTVVPALRVGRRRTGRSRVPLPDWYAGAVGRRGPPAPRVA